jgi:hypothetical protein
MFCSSLLNQKISNENFDDCLYPALRSHFKFSNEKLFLQDLKEISFLQDIAVPLDFSHLPSLFFADQDLDGRFSYSDLERYTKRAQSARHETFEFLPHEWPDRLRALLAIEFARTIDRDKEIVSEWISEITENQTILLKQLLGIGDDAIENTRNFISDFLDEYSKLVLANIK